MVNIAVNHLITKVLVNNVMSMFSTEANAKHVNCRYCGVFFEGHRHQVESQKKRLLLRRNVWFVDEYDFILI